MDYTRLERALQARRYAEAWERHHEPRSESGKEAYRKQQELRQRVDDSKIVDELVRLMHRAKNGSE